MYPHLNPIRIDGSTETKERGKSIRRFQDVEAAPSEQVQLFLISTKSGGIGITLTAANRVVLFDSHWNPCVTEQALYRCYRLVFRKRLLRQTAFLPNIKSFPFPLLDSAKRNVSMRTDS